jgi:hypothetical protein
VTSNSTKLSFIRGHYLYGVIDKEIFPRVTGTEQANNPIAKVSDLFLRRATKTLDAMCVLCEAGFAEDALILGRTIFELAVHLRTIASPDSLEQRRLNAEYFIYDGDRQRVAKLNELAKLKQQGKCHSWITGIESKNPVFETVPIPKNFIRPKNLKQMAAELGGEWECWYHFRHRGATHRAATNLSLESSGYPQDLLARSAPMRPRPPIPAIPQKPATSQLSSAISVASSHQR